jgi:hypothetical protein
MAHRTRILLRGPARNRELSELCELNPIRPRGFFEMAVWVNRFCQIKVRDKRDKRDKSSGVTP